MNNLWFDLSFLIIGFTSHIQSSKEFPTLILSLPFLCSSKLFCFFSCNIFPFTDYLPAKHIELLSPLPPRSPPNINPKPMASFEFALMSYGILVQHILLLSAPRLVYYRLTSSDDEMSCFKRGSELADLFAYALINCFVFICFL